jgi:hypothetical protein
MPTASADPVMPELSDLLHGPDSLLIKG